MELPKNGFFSTVLAALLRPIIRALDRGSLPIHAGELTLAGLNKPVEVRWDKHAIPSVSASSEDDLFFAQGFLHAQERLWQMEMSRRFLCGRMAEIFGDFALPWRELSSQFRGRNCADFDYFVRLLGIRAAAVASLNLLSESDRRRLHSYCSGVNRYIERCGRNLPWEFRLLRHEPEPWLPEDSLTLGKGYAFLLSTALYTRLNFIAVAAKLVDEPDKLRALFPGYPDDAPVTARCAWDQARGLWQFSSGILSDVDWHPFAGGSNGWALAPQRSATGRAILCNDPHLRMTLPSAWYLMHLKVADDQPAGYEVWGASVPGAPCIQIGHNRYIAWGITAAVCDDVEIYREKLHPLDPDLYLAGQRWEKLATTTELIAVRGAPRREKFIRKSRHGPAISDFNQASGGKEILTVRWTAHEPSRELQSLYSINRACDWRQFQESLRHHAAPTLNFIYADREGNIGYTLAGKIPRRAEIPSLLPLAGWDENNEWLGYIPFDELPRVYNPPEGLVANANNRIVDASYPYYLSHFFEPPHRFRRILQLLGQRDKFTIEDMAAVQLDHVSLHAKELIRFLKSDLVEIPADNRVVQTAAQRLLSWNGNCAESSVEAAIFHTFHHRLLYNLLAPVLGDALFCSYVEILNQCIAPTDRILRESSAAWFAGRSRSDLVALSLREACADIDAQLGSSPDGWSWGKIHQLRLNHALGRIDLLKAALSIGPLASPGDGMTVNMGFYRHSNPYAQTVGASLRFAAELGDPVRSGAVLAAGQSGHPTSKYYADQTDLWVRGERIPLAESDELEKRGVRLLLQPARATIAPQDASS